MVWIKTETCNNCTGTAQAMGPMPWRRITVGIVCSDVLIFIEVYRLKLSLVLGLESKPWVVYVDDVQAIWHVTDKSHTYKSSHAQGSFTIPQLLGPTKMRYFLRGVSIFEIEDHQKHPKTSLVSLQSSLTWLENMLCTCPVIYTLCCKHIFIILIVYIQTHPGQHVKVMTSPL